MKNSNTLIFVCFFIILGILGGFYFGKCHFNEKIEKIDTIIKRDTVIDRDTFTFFKDKLVPIYRTVKKIDTVFTEKGDTIPLITENKTYIDTVCAQKDTAIVTSYMSGINAQIDSLRVEMRTTKETITNTIEVTKYITKSKKVNIGLQGGYGYGFKSRQLEPYVGIGVSVNF